MNKRFKGGKRPRGWPRHHRAGCPRRDRLPEELVVEEPACTCGVQELRRVLLGKKPVT